MNTPAPGRVEAAARARAARRRTKHNRWAEELQQDGWGITTPEEMRELAKEKTTMETTALRALARKTHGDPERAIPEVTNAINQIPTATNGQEADALSGPWYVSSNAELANPEDVEITICRGIESRNANDTIRIPGNYETSGEVNAALLRAQAMCAGLNLTSATNGITS